MPLLPSAVTRPLLAVGTEAFRLASRVRGERAVHARGRTLTGTLSVTGGAAAGAPLLDEPASYDVLVRVSRALGLPPALPDILGLAIRVLDAHGPGEHQDLLLDSTRPEPLLRRFPWFGYDQSSALYGSLLPYEIAGRKVVLGARASGQDDELSIALLVAEPRGPWRTWGTVRTDGVLPAPLGRQTVFNPATTGGGIRPAGPLQEWRRRAYPASHVAPDERAG